MKRPKRLSVAVALLAAALLLPAAAPPVSAQSGSDEAAVAASSRDAERQAAREARIQEYLRKKEERRVAREQRAFAEPPAAPAAAAVEATEELPKNLARAQQAVRDSSIGPDPTVRAYLDLIDAQEASPYQLAAFGNFLADNGLVREAVAYYDVALRLEKDDPMLWLNLGTLHRQLGDLSAATSAYGRVLSLDGNNALAHYNMGTILDQQGRYDDALDAYETALTLDPSLGDPRVNPSAANNHRLVAVKLRLYQQQVGNAGTPLVDVPDKGGGD